MPDVYLSAVELERKLREDDLVAAAARTKKLEAEVARLKAKEAAGTAAEEEKTRLALAARLLKYDKGSAELLKTRTGGATFRSGSGEGGAVGSRLSSTVMLHPVNVRRAMASL